MDQVWKAIDEFEMFTKSDRILVAVSGGKDSLALWDILNRLGYQTTGFHLDLGIGGYSGESVEKPVRSLSVMDFPCTLNPWFRRWALLSPTLQI